VLREACSPYLDIGHLVSKVRFGRFALNPILRPYMHLSIPNLQPETTSFL
jgi:hypothetical protein